MRIDSVAIKNFKGFADRKFSFHPEFNLIIGINGTGKSTLIDALAIALSQWQRGPGFGTDSDKKHIEDSDVFLKPTGVSDAAPQHLESQWPAWVIAEGIVLGTQGRWSTRTAIRPDQSTNAEIYADPSVAPGINFKRLVRKAFVQARDGPEVNLPLIASYGTGRLQEGAEDSNGGEYLSPRLSAYKDCYRASMSATRLNSWIEERELASSSAGNEIGSVVYEVFKSAVLACLESAHQLWFDERSRQVLIGFDDGRVVPFRNLSDGQRIILNMVGDIARRAVILNPQLNETVLSEVNGIVLIDELDLHLHPTWQRRVIGDLRRTFPKIQFFCTTHSPFLIQTLSTGDELLSLDSPEVVDPENLGIEAIAAGIMGVTAPEASPNYMAMLHEAKDYLVELDEASRTPADRLESYKKKLADRLAPFAKNPAFQAVLEAERIMKLGK
jgi:predicted ATP-binding protein involved in virulence